MLKGNELPQIKTNFPGRSSKKVIQMDHEGVTNSYSRLFSLAVDEGKGAVIRDVDGNIFIDCTAGIGCSFIGHSQDEIINVINQQASKIIHSGGMVFYNEQMALCAKMIIEATHGTSKKRVVYANSGAEANEVAIKLARYFTKKNGIIYFYGSFHGRTIGTLSINGSATKPRSGFGALLSGTTATPYPYCYRCAFNLIYPECNFACLEFLEREILGSISPPEDTAAIIIEPILSVKGFICPPNEFLFHLKQLCIKYNILLIADEVFTGVGKTGKMFASEHSDVEPDIITTAKAIAGGLPMGVCIGREELFSWSQGSHSSTFAGNHLCCAASIETLRLLKEYNLFDKAIELGNLLRKGLNELQAKYEIIGNINGKGLLLGMELVKDRSTKEPAKNEAKKILHLAFLKGLLLLPGGESSIRFCPSIRITKEQIEKVIEIIEKAIRTI